MVFPFRTPIILSHPRCSGHDFKVIDIPESKSFPRGEDVISLSSDDPITSCAESSHDEPSIFAFSPLSEAPSVSDNCTTHPLETLDEDSPISPPPDHLTYATAGRPFTTPFQDLRSPSQPRHRTHKHNVKYYNNLYIKPGQLNQPHWDTWYILNNNLEPTWTPYLTLPHEVHKPTLMTPKRLYTEAQRPPRPPTPHRRPNYKDRWPFAFRVKNERKVRKQAHWALQLAENEAWGDDAAIEEIVGREHEDNEVDPRVHEWCVCVLGKGCEEYCAKHGYGVR
ncbi:hypothetical protein BST61_g10951 [Cercospora zeina]